MKQTMTKILTTMFCIAAFLGMLDAIISLSDHIATKTVSAGERDVESVNKATEVFINEGGILESRTEYTPVSIENGTIRNAILTDEDLKATKDYTSIDELQPVSLTNKINKQIHNCLCTQNGGTCTCSANGKNCGCIPVNYVKATLVPVPPQNYCSGNSCNACNGNACGNYTGTVVNRTQYYAGQPVRNSIRFIGRGIGNFGRRIFHRIRYPFNGRFRRGGCGGGC